MAVDLDALMKNFRVASRELFNNAFRMYVPDRKSEDVWDWINRFKLVETELFKRLVLDPSALPLRSYGDPDTEIAVKVNGRRIPALINRTQSGAYWDFPIEHLSEEVTMRFVRFFDWDELDFHDSRYVLATIEDWPSHPETAGKQVLFDPLYAKFSICPNPEKEEANTRDA